jgi:antitoxin component YwqK of YwqJK toxin-antitoxin module
MCSKISLRNAIVDCFFAEMRNYSLLLVFWIGIQFFAQGQTQKRVFFDKLQNINEVYHYEGKPFTGVSLERNDTTKKKRIELNWKDGVLHGTKTTWFRDEKLKQVMQFDMGRKHGEYINYYPNGNVKEKGNYHYDTLHGKVEAYYQNGALKFSFQYVKGEKRDWNRLYFENKQIEQEVFINSNGKIDGVFKAWYPDGKPMRETAYQNGIQHGYHKRWHVDGTIAEEGEFKNGKKHGTHRTYEVFVKVPLKVENYDNGKKVGTWITYGLEGDTIVLANYKNDKLHGPYVEYRAGKIENKGVYVDGVKDGFWQLNKVSLLGAQEGNFANGVRIGEWKLFDGKGLLLATIIFDDEGEIVEEKWYQKSKK